jgi:hypothetical protein
MRFTRFAAPGAALCGFALAATAAAQAPVPSAAEPACELHFWATDDALAGANILLNSALQNGVTTGNVLLDALPAEAQAAGLERLDLATLLGLPGLRLVRETEPVRDKVAAHRKGRLTASTAPCYAELAVKRMGYRTDPFFGRDFGAVFIYRRFAPGGATARIIQGGGDVSIKIFPPRDETQREAAREEMTAAFGASFEKFASKKLARPASRP